MLHDIVIDFEVIFVVIEAEALATAAAATRSLLLLHHLFAL
jgi:hypothetical protein